MMNDTKDALKKVPLTHYPKPSQAIKTDKFSSQFNQPLVSDTLSIATLKQIITAIPDSNQERINYLRAQIASDNYIIDSHHIAMQMHKSYEAVK